MRNCSKCMEVCEGSSCLGFLSTPKVCYKQEMVFYLPIYSLDTRGFFRKGISLYRPNLGVELLGCVCDIDIGVWHVTFLGEMES